MSETTTTTVRCDGDDRRCDRREVFNHADRDVIEYYLRSEGWKVTRHFHFCPNHVWTKIPR